MAQRVGKARNEAVALRRRGIDPSVAAPTGDAVDALRARRTLPGGQRVVVVRHHVLDLPVADVARELGLPSGAVKSRLARAHEALGPLLLEETGP